MNELEIIHHHQMDSMSIFFNTVDHRTPHVHPEWELILVLDEPLHVNCGHNRFVAQQGQMVLFCPNEPHEFHKGERSSTFLCLQISQKLLPDMGQQTLLSNLVNDHLDGDDIAQLRRGMRTVLEATLYRRERYELLCMGCACMMLYRLLERMPMRRLTADEALSQDRRNARLKRLIRFVDENYMNKIRLVDFAQAEGCSMSYLSRFIKQHLNQNFQDYVNSVRFNAACRQIAAGEKRMLDVCMESGFSDYRYFSRAFREHYGMTPEQYSHRARQQGPRQAHVRHSLHSVERFYTHAQSLALMERYLK